jgi:hypothetical protein
VILFYNKQKLFSLRNFIKRTLVSLNKALSGRPKYTFDEYTKNIYEYLEQYNKEYYKNKRLYNHMSANSLLGKIKAFKYNSKVRKDVKKMKKEINSLKKYIYILRKKMIVK